MVQRLDKFYQTTVVPQLKEQFNFEHLSMGMSNDYLEASKYNSTYLRIGSKIFGERK